MHSYLSLETALILCLKHQSVGVEKTLSLPQAHIFCSISCLEKIEKDHLILWLSYRSQAKQIIVPALHFFISLLHRSITLFTHNMADRSEEIRFGGPQGEGEEDGEAQRKAKEREVKKAEVRKRLEEAGKKKTKKGFLTPERKKKLRKLLMIKAAENLKSQQLKSEQERQKALSSRVPALPDVDKIEDKGQLEKIYNELFSKMVKLEEEKYDINYQVSTKDSDINELSIAVNDLRGKFVKPALKKVSKYDNKFKKLAESPEGGPAKTAKQDFRSQLKVVKKENVIEELVAKTKKSDKPEWSKKGKEGGDPAAPPKPAKPAKPAGGAAEEEQKKMLEMRRRRKKETRKRKSKINAPVLCAPSELIKKTLSEDYPGLDYLGFHDVLNAKKTWYRALWFTIVIACLLVEMNPKKFNATTKARLVGFYEVFRNNSSVDGFFEYFFDTFGLQCDEFLQDCRLGDRILDCCKIFEPEYLIRRGRCFRSIELYKETLTSWANCVLL
uniref:Troponin I n=1 Tax=Ditylenchus dipsaci TaxID=166011 RepID=A0A915DGH2_9BILA